MSETDNNTRLPKRSLFDLTTVSLGLALGGLFMVGLFGEMVTAGPAAGIGLAFGLLGLYQTKRGGRKLHKAIAAVVMNCLLLLLALSSVGTDSRKYELAQRLVCGTNLRNLGKVLEVYANDTGRRSYPAANKWCDLLLRYNELEEKERVDKRWFICKGAVKAGDKGPCHYAINPDCKPNSPGDMVLLFETKGGWNRFGGPEILTTENHRGKGCNILFNDGSVKFVKTEELGKLKWTVAESN